MPFYPCSFNPLLKQTEKYPVVKLYFNCHHNQSGNQWNSAPYTHTHTKIGQQYTRIMYFFLKNENWLQKTCIQVHKSSKASRWFRRLITNYNKIIKHLDAFGPQKYNSNRSRPFWATKWSVGTERILLQSWRILIGNSYDFNFNSNWVLDRYKKRV